MFNFSNYENEAQKVEDQGLELKHKQAEITELKARLEKLEQWVNRRNEGAK